jgi:hypothetical protein
MVIEKASQTVFTPLADSSAVLLNLNTLLYFKLNRTGAAVWKQIEEWQILTLEDLVKSVCERFEVGEAEAREFIRQFVGRLEEFQMIRIA